MKRFFAPAVLAAALLGLAGTQLHSQTDAPAATILPGTPRTPLQTLQAIKAENQKLLDQQAATLQQLEALQEQAKQVRILAKRS